MIPRGVFCALRTGSDVALDHLFQGSALNAVDGKGRVSIPSFLRSVIERRGDAKTIVLAKHANFPALSAYDPAYAALMHATLRQLSRHAVPHVRSSRMADTAFVSGTSDE